MLEFRVKLIKVNYIVMSATGSEFAFRVNGDIGVITFVGKEWGNSGGSRRGIVVGEFTEREETGPVVLLVVAEDPEILLKGLIEPFGLSVAFRVITGGEVNLHVQGLT